MQIFVTFKAWKYENHMNEAKKTSLMKKKIPNNLKQTYVTSQTTLPPPQPFLKKKNDPYPTNTRPPRKLVAPTAKPNPRSLASTYARVVLYTYTAPLEPPPRRPSRTAISPNRDNERMASLRDRDLQSPAFPLGANSRPRESERAICFSHGGGSLEKKSGAEISLFMDARVCACTCSALGQRGSESACRIY